MGEQDSSSHLAELGELADFVRSQKILRHVGLAARAHTEMGAPVGARPGRVGQICERGFMKLGAKGLELVGLVEIGPNMWTWAQIMRA